MKRHLLAIALTLMAACSCEFLNPGNYPIYTNVYGYVQVMGNTLYYESGTGVLEVTEDDTDGKWHFSDRIFICCDMLEVNEAGTGYKIHLKNYTPVTVKGVVLQQDADEDALGSDAITYYEDWGYDRLLKTLDFSVVYAVKADSGQAHDVNLVFDGTRSTTDSLFFRLRHNGHGETYENEALTLNDIKTKAEFFSFDISTVMPGVPGDKTVVTVEGSWYKSTDGQIISREKDPSEYVATYNLKSN